MSNLTTQIATHLREVHFGGNWTCVNYRETLAGVSWQQATTKVQDFNTIAVLVYHTGYYASVVISVLKGSPLNSKDEYSFMLPPISSEEEWQALLEQTWRNAETLAAMIEQLPEQRLWEIFVDTKYKNYCRNLLGLIEHLHYHLGQIVLIKKLLAQDHPTLTKTSQHS